MNHGYSKVQCRVEHVFGALGNETRVRYKNCLGFVRKPGLDWLGQFMLQPKEVQLSEADWGGNRATCVKKV